MRGGAIGLRPRLGRRAPHAAYVCVAGLAMGSPAYLSGTVLAQDAGLGTVAIDRQGRALDSDGIAIVVDQIVPTYAWSREGEPFEAHEGLPAVGTLLDTSVRLLRLEDGFAAERPGSGLPTVNYTLAQLNAMGEKTLYRSAVVSIMEAIRSRLNEEHGVIGVFAYPPEIVLAGSGEDRRAAGDRTLAVRVLIGWVEDVRTIGGGDLFTDENRRNSARHARIRNGSPVAPSSPESRDVLDRRALDDYVLWLNRHPGRAVNLGVGAGGSNDGGVIVDYHVFEAKPWYVYFQVSNTGTETTNEWRERFGFVHNQLTNNDDILTIDYITAGFDSSHAVVAAYDAPFPGVDRLRWNVEASYNEFTASDIGLSGEGIEGDGWSAGGGLVYNVYQDREIFVDAHAGVRYRDVSLDNPTANTSGESGFWTPNFGLSLDRLTEISAFRANAEIEIGIAEEDEDELVKLGRDDVDTEWAQLNYGVEWSFFLEPVLFRSDFEDPDTTWNPRKTLAHEVSFQIRGQEAFGARLVPNYQAVTGGAATVRGYPESEVPSDSVTIFTAEYRYHVPRAFRPGAEPWTVLGESFKFRPQRTWGRPDWDLVLKGFLDVARATNNGDVSFEEDETLVGAGIGAEFQFRRNFVMSLDWGFALEDTEEVDSGDNELHFILTLLY